VTPDGLVDFAELVESDADHHYDSWRHGAGQVMDRIPRLVGLFGR
jgi:hypothetical protein